MLTLGHTDKMVTPRRGLTSWREKAVASLHTAGLGKKFLRNAIEYVVAVENRLPRIGKDSPINTFFSTTGQWREIPRMAPFGCRALALIPQHLRKKEHKVRREECILLGLADGSKNGYRLLKMETMKEIVRGDGILVEGVADGIRSQYIRTSNSTLQKKA